ncbi:hypothetical protein SSX86_029733 [Deinandra increscens subsp. villosa]|uniref:RRM domain-containing protein n=1 Tax=Deinandra increscens subsp. villosa TaxID=3103831 RepID=A0AAP0CD25_9ASTR
MADATAAALLLEEAKSKLTNCYGVNNIHLKVRVLDGTKVTYSTWVKMFQLQVKAYKVSDHIEDVAPPEATDPLHRIWAETDAVILQWIYGTISDEFLGRIIDTDTTARKAWVKLQDIFQNNKGSRAAALEQEFTTLTLASCSSMDAYCQKIHDLAEQLTDVGRTVDEDRKVLQLVRGLPSEYDTVATIINQSQPTWDEARNMLQLELQRIAGRNQNNPPTNQQVLLANTTIRNNSNNPNPSPNQPQQPTTYPNRPTQDPNFTTYNYYPNQNRSQYRGRGGNRNNNRRGGGRNSRNRPNYYPPSYPSPPPYPFYPTPPPPSPYPSQPVTHYQPHYPPPQPNYPRPNSSYNPPQAHFTSANHPPYSGYDAFSPTDLGQAVQGVQLQQPSHTWYMDTGASNHLAANPEREKGIEQERPDNFGEQPWKTVKRRSKGESHNLFISGFSDSTTVGDLWGSNQQLGMVWDIYISKKKRYNNENFGFIRFKNVHDADALTKRLNKFSFKGRRLRANLSVVPRKGDTAGVTGGKGMIHVVASRAVKGHNFTTIGGKTSAIGVWQERSYKQAFPGEALEEICKNKEVGVTHPPQSFGTDFQSKIRRIVIPEEASIYPVSFFGRSLLREANSGESLVNIKEGQDFNRKRITCLIIHGVPLNVRDDITFNAIGTTFGKIVWPSYTSWVSENSVGGEVQILTDYWKSIEEVVSIEVGGSLYTVMVKECPNSWVPVFVEDELYEFQEDVRDGEGVVPVPVDDSGEHRSMGQKLSDGGTRGDPNVISSTDNDSMILGEMDMRHLMEPSRDDTLGLGLVDKPNNTQTTCMCLVNVVDKMGLADKERSNEKDAFCDPILVIPARSDTSKDISSWENEIGVSLPTYRRVCKKNKTDRLESFRAQSKIMRGGGKAVMWGFFSRALSNSSRTKLQGHKIDYTSRNDSEIDEESRHKGRWLVMGDYNAVRSPEGRLGSIFCPYFARDFNEFIVFMGFVDVGLSNIKFTYVSASNGTMSRLDRFLVCHDLLAD